jgi:hypothetical protein
MRATRKHNQIVLTVGHFEAQVLEGCLRSILLHYQAAPEQLDPKIAEVWYSTRGCRSAKMSEAETREWRQGLREFKSANLKLIKSWMEQLEAGTGENRRLQLSLEEAAALVSVVNDHRLFLAAKFDIGQAEMDLHSLEALHELQPGRQFALYQIHLLAWLMEELLRSISPDAANWMER